MTLLKRITKENAGNEEIIKMFTMMEDNMGLVPEVLRMVANSPGLFRQQLGQIGYYRSHDRLGPELLTLIRYTAASLYENKACVDFNGMLLRKQGMSDEELAAVTDNPTSAPLEEKDKEMLCFVIDGIKDQGSASQDKMDKLRSFGWRTSDIVDAVNYGFSMFAPGKALMLFKMM